MDDIKYVALTEFQLEPSLDDKFWLEKIKRYINDCRSVTELQEVAILLAKIATQRQGAIRGLVQELFIFRNIAVDQEDITNPDVTSK